MPPTGLEETKPLDHCRACGSSHLDAVFNLGRIPVVNEFQPAVAGTVAEKTAQVPLLLLFCRQCALVQTHIALDRSVIFGAAYPYLSSMSGTLLAEARGQAARLIDELQLGDGSLVIEIASNDGYMLRHFLHAGIACLGVEPAPIPARHARSLGIPVLQAFFNAELAKRIWAEFGHADLLIAKNVLAHVEDPADLMDGLGALLKPGGVLVVEVQYLPDLLDLGAFDMIYHEHHSYFLLTAMVTLMHGAGLAPYHAERLSAQGGSLRVHAMPASHQPPPTAVFEALLRQEKALIPELHKRFSELEQGLQRQRNRLHQVLAEIRADGGRIVGYGAAAKAVVLVNVCELANHLEYVVDKNPAKQGCLLPGTNLLITGPDQLGRQPPTHLLVLAWNIAEEVMHSLEGTGLPFILPFPEVRVLQ